MIDTSPPIEPTNESSPQGGPGYRPPISTMAVIAVILAFIPLCPPVNALGAVLGLISLRRIRESAGRLGGRRVALVATIAGIVLSILWIVLSQWFATLNEKQLQKDMGLAIDSFLHAAEEGKPGEAMTRWSVQDAKVSEDEITAFGAALEKRLGAFESVDIVLFEQATGGSLIDLNANCSTIIYRFKDGERNGSARFALKFNSHPEHWWAMLPLLEEIRIKTGEGEELVLPPVRKDEEEP